LDGGDDDAGGGPATTKSDIETGDTLDLSELGSGARVDLDVNNQGVLQGPNDKSDSIAPGLSESGRVSDGDGNEAEVNDFENVIGTKFDDVIFGNAQNNVLMGGDGDDVLHPFAGDDHVDGGNGTDTLLLNGFPKGVHVDMKAGIAEFIDGSGGTNTFVNIENVNGSSVAGDKIIGDHKDNVLNGLGGDDTLRGGGGDDHLIGGDNVDRARADAEGKNEDLLIGGKGKDHLEGGLGDDDLRGGSGRDTLDGGDGDDRMVGGRGNDVQTGGDGIDRFIFRDHDGHDQITDFDAAYEVINLRKVSEIKNFHDLADNHISQHGDDVVIDDHAGTRITLQDVHLADLDADNFLF
ncbi:MAG: hypothetical protein AAGA05_10815, partial [Pseudomonadota bacterium]